MLSRTNEKTPCERQFASGLLGTFNHICNDYDSTINEVNQVEYTSNVYTETTELCSRFAPKRQGAILLSNAYDRLGLHRKANFCAECGTLLTFAHEVDSFGNVSDKGKLYNANFCRDRLCPMCAWRRSYKIFGQVSQIMNVIENKYTFVFLTLTVPNVSACDLDFTLDRMFSAWKKFIKYKAIKGTVQGFFRALEITRNAHKNTYHPHFHCVLAMPKDYIRKHYISRDTFLDYWRKAYGDRSITQVDVRTVKPKIRNGVSSGIASVVAEISKYAVKDTDYIFSDEVIALYNSVLKGRRLVAFGGVFKQIHADLGLDDTESDSADLVHLTDSINPCVALLITEYSWSVGVYELKRTRLETVSGNVLDVD